MRLPFQGSPKPCDNLSVYRALIFLSKFSQLRMQIGRKPKPEMSFIGGHDASLANLRLTAITHRVTFRVMTHSIPVCVTTRETLMSDERAHVRLRLPLPLKDWITQAAAENYTTLNGQIVAMLVAQQSQIVAKHGRPKVSRKTRAAS
jgi:hypothetical protein